MAIHATFLTLTEAEYLELDARRSKIRYEYVDDYIFAMSGTTKQHNRITGNLYSQILAHLQSTTCQVYMSDVKVSTEAGIFQSNALTPDPGGRAA